ncbi:hypothetical protein XBJ2_870116 [Xenorhabdus bovienii str. Jollieti]|uniref:Uncharacterized protein n=1 Tax=Xenorhabdus bovienii (strain SS-2004) TaxID=406818 RepID=D3V0Z5_XENBS|nr:hypothetical protein XBJ1_1701 [Xenorhabdus bovienii SS-2004]CDH30537.1 hypothetical protein XBJ2_870116 [Xenorhabdus bovienii str. Jollieti]
MKLSYSSGARSKKVIWHFEKSFIYLNFIFMLRMIPSINTFKLLMTYVIIIMKRYLFDC